MLKNILLVAFGGALGSVFRYLMARYFYVSIAHWSTFLINIAGSFVIGLLFAYTLKHPESKWISPLLIFGLCGGFTTFSTFSLDLFKLMQQQWYTHAFLYAFSSVVFCLIATYVAFLLVK